MPIINTTQNKQEFDESLYVTRFTLTNAESVTIPFTKEANAFIKTLIVTNSGLNVNFNINGLTVFNIPADWAVMDRDFIDNYVGAVGPSIVISSTGTGTLSGFIVVGVRQ